MASVPINPYRMKFSYNMSGYERISYVILYFFNRGKFLKRKNKICKLEKLQNEYYKIKLGKK